MIFAAVFFMFLNTGPSNTILANVVHPAMRPAGFAVNILVIHVLGDVISPPIIGRVSGYWNMSVGFTVVSAFLAVRRPDLAMGRAVSRPRHGNRAATAGMNLFSTGRMGCPRCARRLVWRIGDRG